MLKLFKFLSKFDPVLTVGGWGWALLSAVGITGAVILTWFMLQIDWLWHTFGPLVFVILGLYTFILLMIALNFFIPQTGGSTMVPFLDLLGLTCFVGVAIILMKDRPPVEAENQKGTPNINSVNQPKELSEDQKQFRVSLKQFSVVSPYVV